MFQRSEHGENLGGSLLESVNLGRHLGFFCPEGVRETLAGNNTARIDSRSYDLSLVGSGRMRSAICAAGRPRRRPAPGNGRRTRRAGTWSRAWQQAHGRVCEAPAGPREWFLVNWFGVVRRVGEASHPGPGPGEPAFQDWRSANITGFCHAEAALAWGADVLGLTELRGSPVEAARVGKKFGKAVACSLPEADGKSLAAIFYCGTKGKEAKMPCLPGWGQRLAAIQVRLSEKAVCTVVCLYGHSNPTKELLDELDQQLHQLLEYHAGQGKGPMMIMGDLNATSRL